MANERSNIEAEVQRIKAHLGSMPGASCTTTRAVAKAILSSGWYFYNGRQLTPKAKSLGLGVYKVSVEVSRD